jgi:ubiquinone biosynthesis protein COQ4
MRSAASKIASRASSALRLFRAGGSDEGGRRAIDNLVSKTIYKTVSNQVEGLMFTSLPLPRYDLPRAGRALAALLRDPDDLPQVFTLIDTMSGTAPHRLLFKMRRSESGARVLRNEPDIVPTLADREALRKLPEGSLGRAYLAFVESEGISAEGIRTASDAGEEAERRPAMFDYIHQRMRDTHDLWHAATGYKGDVVGELSLLAFTLAQHWNTAVAVIVVAGLIKGLGQGETSAVIDGYRRGRAAEWLPGQEWEKLLPLQVSEVRARLKLGAPPVYRQVRTSELRAEGVVG